MSAVVLLQTLHAQGYTVTASADGLQVGPAARLTDELRAAIRTHKPALLALLAGPPDQWVALRDRLAAGILDDLDPLHLLDGSTILDVAAYTRRRLADLDDPRLAPEAAKRLRRLQAALDARSDPA
jgi:hypothetical protein